jgi:hypothetical protein
LEATAVEAVDEHGRGLGAEPSDPLFVETVVLDGMWRVADDNAEHGRRYRIAWFDPPFRAAARSDEPGLGHLLHR